MAAAGSARIAPAAPSNENPPSAAPNATVYSPVRSFNDDQRVRFRKMLQRTYDGFVQRVAAGRKTAEEEVEPFCRGRVWTGRQAMTHNLVDRYGTLDDALERARSLAGMHANQYQRIDITPAPKRTLLNRLVQQAVPAFMRARTLG